MGPTPPVEMQSPALAYNIFYLIFAVQFIGALGWLITHAVKTRSRLPLIVFAGSLFVGYFTPPLFNQLLMTWFPSNIPWSYISAFGMKDPLFDFVGYALYFGLGGYMMMRALQRGSGGRAVAVTAVAFGIADLLYELPFLAAGLYTYYGQQPFAILTFPLHWLVMNSAVPVITGFITYWADRLSTTEQGRAVAVFASPILSAAALFVPMTPIATMLRADVPTAARQAASLLAIAITVTTVYFIARWAQQNSSSAVDAGSPARGNPLAAR
jgi:hypothetical protein